MIFPQKSGRLSGSFLLHLRWRKVVESRVDALVIVEAFDVLKQVPFCRLSSFIVAVMNKSGFERVEKLSIGALPQQLPLRDIDGVMSAGAKAFW
jgi:hypothetical protein